MCKECGESGVSVRWFVVDCSPTPTCNTENFVQEMERLKATRFASLLPRLHREINRVYRGYQFRSDCTMELLAPSLTGDCDCVMGFV
jgi:hypothetical protein